MFKFIFRYYFIPLHLPSSFVLHRKKSLASLLAGALLAGSLSMGCAYNISKEYPSFKHTGSLEKDIEAYESKYEFNPESAKMRMLLNYFTPEAVEKLKHIPVVEAHFLFNDQIYAAGRNFFINVVQSIGGYGWGRKTIIKDSNPKNASFTHEMLHEYIHHASSLGFIDDNEFDKAWKKLSADPKYVDLVKAIEKQIDDNYCPFLMKIIPFWRTIEREAFLAVHVACGYFTKEVTEEFIDITSGAKGSMKMNMILIRDIPDYVKKVYHRTLIYRKFQL